jgi:exodeoxyribonuclease VII small subunit
MKEKETKYEDAMQELNQILEEIDNQEIKIDELVKKVRRGAELIKTCKKKLTEIETEVSTVLDDLEQSFQTENKDEKE